MLGCTNQASQWVPRGFDYVESKGECGRTGWYNGWPVYCDECLEAEEKRGHAKHECHHGVELYPEDGRDIPCWRCESEE